MDIQTLAAAIAVAKKINSTPEYVTAAVEAWLSEHVDPSTGYVLDDTLTVEGAAADAKAAGEAVGELKSQIGTLITPIDWTTGGYIFTAGSVGSVLSLTPTSNANYNYAIVDVLEGDVVCINGTGAGNAFLWTFIDDNNRILSKSAENAVGNDLQLTAPTNASKLVLNTKAAAAGICYKGQKLADLVNEANIIGDSGKYRIVAGVIRNSGSGWEFIVNANHRGDLNCDEVGIYQADGRLYVDYSDIHVKKVISLICAPDETFASLGYLMGASVGLNAAYIQIYQYGMSSVSGRVKFVNGDNGVEIQVEASDGIISATWNQSDNTLDITHASIVTKVSGAAPIISVIPTVYGKYLARVYSYGGSSTRLEFFDTTTGQKVTSPDTKMSLLFGRMGTALQKNEIDPLMLADAIGNIWFMGIFEV